jgi:hypothetical protein
MGESGMDGNDSCFAVTWGQPHVGNAMGMSIWHSYPPLSKKQVKKWPWGKT